MINARWKEEKFNAMSTRRSIKATRCGIGSDVLLRVNLASRSRSFLAIRNLLVSRITKSSCDLFLENRVDRVLKNVYRS